MANTKWASLLGEQVATGPALGTVAVAGTAITGGKFALLNATGGLADGDNFLCFIKDQAGPKWEISIAKYTASGTVVSRQIVLASSESSGGLVNFNAPVYIFALITNTTVAAAGAGTAAGTAF